MTPMRSYAIKQFLWMVPSLLAAAGCVQTPQTRPAPLDQNIPAVAPASTSPSASVLEADGERTVLLSLAFRQEMRRGKMPDSYIIHHVDLTVGDRIAGFYNDHPQSHFRTMVRGSTGAVHGREWMEENRRHFLDAETAKSAVIRGREVWITTVWIGTRITPEEAERIQDVIDRRLGRPLSYHLIERNCVSRIADILYEAGWFAAPPGRRGNLPGVDRPALLLRAFVDRAGSDRVWKARGWFSVLPDGSVRIDSLDAR